MQEKWLNLSKNSELCGILICPIPIFPSLQLHGNLENQNPAITVKTSSPLGPWRGQNAVGAPLKPHLQRIVII